jgi:hypothetical protein
MKKLMTLLILCCGFMTLPALATTVSPIYYCSSGAGEFIP